MKISKIFAMMAAVGLLMGFSSCGNDDEVGATDNGAVRFSAGVDNQAVQNGNPTTKAAGTAWAPNDPIGIFMVNHGFTTVAESAANKKYMTLSGDGNFSAVTGNEIYYPMDGSGVDFIAYYPHTPSKAIDDAIDVDISGTQDATKQAGIDLLWTRANGTGGAGYSKTSGIVGLNFQHKLVKIVINCKAEANTGIAANDFNSASVVISGMNTKTSMNLESGIVAAASDVANIVPRKLTTATSGFLASYDAIILSHTYAANDVTVVFTVNGEPYTWKLAAPDAAFVSGNEYTYEVTLTRTGASVTGTINPWITSGNERPRQTAE